MVMGVDQPGQQHVPAQVQHLVGAIRQLAGRSGLLDEAIPHKKTTIGDLPAHVVHRDEHAGMTDKKSGHVIGDLLLLIANCDCGLGGSCLTSLFYQKIEAVSISCLTNVIVQRN